MTTTSAPTAAAADAAPNLALITDVDPASLRVLDQARADATPDDDLIASVRERGILQPPIVVRDEDDELVILTGHRRVGAAIIAGLTSISVIERTDLTADQARRLTDQIIENERRKSLTALELAGAYEQLTLFGLSPADIAQAVSDREERVRSAIKVAKTPKITEALQQHPSIDLAKAAAIADFADDTKTTARLVETATLYPHNFERDLAAAINSRKLAARIAQLRDEVEASGVPLLDYPAGQWNPSTYFRGDDGLGASLKRLNLDVDEHASCPGHAAVLSETYSLGTAAIGYVCTDWNANGHTDPNVATVSTEDAAAAEERRARWQQEQEEREAQRAALAAAAAARRHWIHAHLTVGRLRPAAAHFELIADSLAIQIHTGEGADPGVMLELLTGGQHPTNMDAYESAVRAILEQEHPPFRVALAAALSSFETQPTYGLAYRYITLLEQLGYTPSDTDRELQEQARADLTEVKADLYPTDAGDVVHEDEADDVDEDQDAAVDEDDDDEGSAS